MTQKFYPSFITISAYIVHVLLLGVVSLSMAAAFGLGGFDPLWISISIILGGIIITISPLFIIYYQEKGFYRLGYFFIVYLALEIWGIITIVPKMIKDLAPENQYQDESIVYYYPFFIIVFALIFTLHVFMLAKTVRHTVQHR